LFLFSFAEELTESLAEASDLTFLADLLLFAGIEGWDALETSSVT
jgi:hypothetical protein